MSWQYLSHVEPVLPVPRTGAPAQVAPCLDVPPSRAFAVALVAAVCAFVPAPVQAATPTGWQSATAMESPSRIVRAVVDPTTGAEAPLRVPRALAWLPDVAVPGRAVPRCVSHDTGAEWVPRIVAVVQPIAWARPLDEPTRRPLIVETRTGAEWISHLRPSAYARRVISDGASAYWRLDESTGSFIDKIQGLPSVPSGTLTRGVLAPIRDDYPRALEFDGSTGYTEAADNAAWDAGTAGDLTLELWFRNTHVSGSGEMDYLVDCKTAGTNNAGFNLGVLPVSGALTWRIANGAAQVSAAVTGLQDGLWHHVVCLVTRGTPDLLSIYVDGVFRASASPAANGWDISPSAPLDFGRYNTLGSGINPGHFYGALDEVAFYRLALTAQQIADHYALRSAAPIPWSQPLELPVRVEPRRETATWSEWLPAIAPSATTTAQTNLVATQVTTTELLADYTPASELVVTYVRSTSITVTL